MLVKVKSGLKWNSSSALVQAIIKVARGLLIPKILPSIAQYGLFTSLNLYTRYLNFTDLGSKEYLLKHLPKLHSNNKPEEEKWLINDTLTFQFLTLFGISIYLLISSFNYSGENEDFYRPAIFLLIPVVFFARGKDILSIIASSRRQYSYVATTQMILDLSSLILTVLGVLWKGAIGGVLGMLIANIIAFVYIYKRSGLSYRFSWQFLSMDRLKDYWSLFSVYFLDTISNSYDLLIILLLYNATDYGLYSFGQIFIWVMIAISGVLQSSLHPKIFSLAVSEGNQLKDILNISLIVYLVLCLLVLPFLVFGVNILLNFYLEKYLVGLSIFNVMLLMALFRGMNVMIKVFYIAINKEAIYRKILLISILIFLPCLLYFISKAHTLQTIVYGFLSIDLILFLSLALFFLREKIISHYGSILLLLTGFISFVVLSKFYIEFDVRADVEFYILMTVALYAVIFVVLAKKKKVVMNLLNM